MITGHFYFIKDEFYDSLSDCGLALNKDTENGKSHGRPCHYCFEYNGVYWMVPISSQVEKYTKIYEKKVSKRGYCDTIRFGYVNGSKRAFLIQNAFPVTERYIADEYKINHNTIPVIAGEKTSKEINGLIRKVIRQYKRGINIPLTNLKKIYEFLNKEES